MIYTIKNSQIYEMYINGELIASNKSLKEEHKDSDIEDSSNEKVFEKK